MYLRVTIRFPNKPFTLVYIYIYIYIYTYTHTYRNGEKTNKAERHRENKLDI